MKKFIGFCLSGLSFFVQGQEVNKEFTRLLLNEQFDRADKNWGSTFNADNLFIAQNGYYELYRLSAKSGYYLFPAETAEYSAFQLDASLIFSEHTNKRQSAGIMLMAGKQSGGGISVEINQKKEYRIVRVYKDRQNVISGGGDGWVRAGRAITKGENLITVRTYNRVYDLYVNGIFLQSFTDIELQKGEIGIYVGPDSKVKFDYLKVLGEDISDFKNLDVKDSKGEEQAFTQIIVRLKDQINKKDKEIDEYKTKLKLCESSSAGRTSVDTASAAERTRLMARLAVMEEENEDLQIRLMRAQEELEELKDFREGVEKGDDGDIVINLTNMVSNQKNTIELLEKKNKSLNDENNSLFMETKDLTRQLDKSSNELSKEKEKSARLQEQLDSIIKVNQNLRDSAAMKKNDNQSGNPEPELTEEEKLQRMIEKEREERRKKREEEERRRKEEMEKEDEGQ